MSLLDTEHKRKSAVITGIILALLLFAIINLGLTYLDPPEELGIAVNFGTTDVGSGTVQPVEPIKSEPVQDDAVEETEVEETVEEVVEETPTEQSVAEPVAEEVVTQESEESIKMKQREEARRKQAEAERKAKAESERKEREKKAAEEKKRKAQEAKRQKLDAMMGGINNSKGTASGGEGDDNQAGDKGNPNGDPNSSGYYGTGGSGNSGNYRLGNRKAVAKPKPKYDCNEEGKVVVKISVNKNGNVIGATPGIKGTTNSAPCLLKRAKEAALKTKFNSDSKAPVKQVGSIIYNFSLSK